MARRSSVTKAATACVVQQHRLVTARSFQSSHPEHGPIGGWGVKGSTQRDNEPPIAPDNLRTLETHHGPQKLR